MDFFPAGKFFFDMQTSTELFHLFVFKNQNRGESLSTAGGWVGMLSKKIHFLYCLIFKKLGSMVHGVWVQAMDRKLRLI